MFDTIMSTKYVYFKFLFGVGVWCFLGWGVFVETLM